MQIVEQCSVMTQYDVCWPLRSSLFQLLGFAFLNINNLQRLGHELGRNFDCNGEVCTVFSFFYYQIFLRVLLLICFF